MPIKLEKPEQYAPREKEQTKLAAAVPVTAQQSANREMGAAFKAVVKETYPGLKSRSVNLSLNLASQMIEQGVPVTLNIAERAGAFEKNLNDAVSEKIRDSFFIKKDKAGGLTVAPKSGAAQDITGFINISNHSIAFGGLVRF